MAPSPALAVVRARFCGSHEVMSPLTLVLEFARSELAGDPFAFRLGAQEYVLRREDGSLATSRLVWDEALLADLAAVRVPGCEPALLARLGEILRGFLLPLGWHEREAALQAALSSERRILLCIRSAAAELYALPWELLSFKATGQKIGEIPSVLLRYEWPGTSSALEAPDSAPRREDGRILFAWSAAGGRVPASEHLSSLCQASQTADFPFRSDADVLPHASCAGLSSALRAARRDGRDIAVLHLLCHGIAAGRTFGLAVDKAEGDGVDVVDAGRLRQILAPYADTLRLVVLCACESGHSGALGNQLGSVAQALHRAGIAAVLASRYPLSMRGSVLLTRTLYTELLGGPHALEASLLSARRRLIEEGTGLDWASLMFYARQADGDDTRPLVFRPFRGLLRFEPEHRRFFFGRDREIAAITSGLRALEHAGRPRFLIVAGASGSGKSSVVLSGAVPQLLRDSARPLRLIRLRPGEAPPAMAPQGPGEGSRDVLIVADQLEEVFTQISDPRLRQQWVQELWRLSQDPGARTSVILTLRVDFLGRCGELLLAAAGLRLDSVAYDEAHRVFVPQLGPDALATVINAPVDKAGLALEEGLAERILDDLGAEPGALPLLQYTLDLLWQQRRGRMLTQRAYDALGGVSGALNGRAEALYQAMSLKEQRAARRLLVRLCQVGDDPAQGTRRRVPRSRLQPEGSSAEGGSDPSLESALNALTQARLLVCSGEGQQQLVEIAHEALIRRWPRLVQWVQQDRLILAEIETLERWVEERDQRGTLLSSKQLAVAERILEHHREECSGAARALVRDSQARLRRQRGMRGAAIAALGLAMLLSSLLAWYAWTKRRDAERLRIEAHRSLMDSYVERGRQFLIERGDALRALLWLDRAYQAGHDSPGLRLLLGQALRSLDSLRFTVEGTQPVWCPDGRCLLTESGGTLRVWEAPSGRLLRSAAGSAPSFSRDGRRIVVSRDGGTRSEVLEFATLGRLFALGTAQHPSGPATFSPDGSQLVSVGPRGDVVTLWSGQDGAFLRSLPVPELLTQEVLRRGRGYARAVFTQDKRLIVSEGACPVAVWDAESGALRRAGDRSPCTAAVSTQGGRVLTRDLEDKYSDGGIQIFEAEHGTSLQRSSCDGLFRSAVLSSSGTSAAVLPASGELRLLEVDTGTARTLYSPLGQLAGLAFDRYATRLLTTTTNKVGFLWAMASGRPTQALLDIEAPGPFSPNGGLLASPSQDEKVQVFDTDAADRLPGLDKVRSSKADRPFLRRKSPDERWELVPESSSQEDPGVVRLVDTGRHETRFLLDHCEGGGAVDASFSRDGSFIFTWALPHGDDLAEFQGVDSATVKIWDPSNGALLATWTGGPAEALVGSLAVGGQRPVLADGTPWELALTLPTRAEVAEFLRCRVPLRFDGDALVPQRPASCLTGAAVPSRPTSR